MIHHCTVYKIDTGEIAYYSNFSCEDDPDFIRANFEIRALAIAPEGYAYVEVASDAQTQYVQTLNGEITVVAKPQLVVTLDKTEITADGVDVASLTGLPDPCTILVDDDDELTETTVIAVTGGGFTFSTEDPGDYTIEVRDRFPFLPFRTVITAS